MFSRVNNTSQNIITTARTQEYGRIYSYMYTAAITGHLDMNIKIIYIKSAMKQQKRNIEENLAFIHYEIMYSFI